ncbi:NAD(P)-binding protein [Candidatus Dependentiae bacterium]|nr:NAD(P)-binding protein [Candidatus Dependentiae bacterium]
MDEKLKKNVVIIGAGPAGLTAAFELLKSSNFNVQILEKDSVVGGLSKTLEYKKCKFDIGPHHFITESEKINKWWHDVMEEERIYGNDFIQLSRFTRIYYKNHLFHYPLQPLNVLRGLSIFECIRCILSYLKIRMFPIKNVSSFQDWVTNRFGHRLFSIFFKTYTEKVWGISCKEISADWAAQRIKRFSLSSAIFYAFFGRWFKKNVPRTLNDKFFYPSFGAGTLWNKVCRKIYQDYGGKIALNQNVVRIKHKNFKIKSLLTYNSSDKANDERNLTEHFGDYFLSSMPLKDLILRLDPLPGKMIVNAAKKLCYRALITVNLIVNKKNICPDHWLYIHEKEVMMGRIGNMNNFSMYMVDDDNHTGLSLEYFTYEHDVLWKMSDDKILEIGKAELQKMGLVKSEDIIDGMILREGYAYPVYDANYQDHLRIILDYLNNFSNLKLMGRNGLHQYNNMDLAMISAIQSVEDIIKNEELILSNQFVKNEKHDLVV